MQNKNYPFYQADDLDDLRHLVKRAAEKFTHKTAFSYRKDGNVHQKNYIELDHDVDALGTALINLGLKGAHIAVIGSASYEWIISYLAVVNGTGVIIPIDKELPADEIQFLLTHSGAKAILFDKKYEDALRSIQDSLPELKHMICFEDDGMDTYPYNVEKLLRRGSSLMKAGDRSFLDAPLDRYAMTAILYTSGTTGTSKGVMLSHYNISGMIAGALRMIEIKGRLMSVLPLHHSYECNLDVLGSIYTGVGLFINDNLKNTLVNMKYAKPVCICLVPLFLETFYKKIWAEAKKSGKDKLLKAMIASSNVMLKAGVDLRRKLFKSVLDAFGGELEMIVCGGAPLNPDLVTGFANIGITVLNGYGTTECSPLISVNRPHYSRFGSVGQVLGGCQVRIDNPDEEGNGEIVFTGPNVMIGYYKNPEATAAVFTEDRWYRTGDLGHLDEDGFVFITGRAKNMIVLKNGKNVFPEEIEDYILRAIPYVKEVVVYSVEEDGSEVALKAEIYPEPEFVASMDSEQFSALLWEDIKKINAVNPLYKRVTMVKVRDTEFDKTASHKIRRNLISKA